MKAWSADGKRVVNIETANNIVTWTEDDLRNLRGMVKFGVNRSDMAVHLGRSESSIVSKMHEVRNKPSC